MHHSGGLRSHVESNPPSSPRPTAPCIIQPLTVSMSAILLFPHSSPASLLFLGHGELILAQGLCEGSSPGLKFPCIVFGLRCQLLGETLLTPHSQPTHPFPPPLYPVLLIFIAPTTLWNYFTYLLSIFLF